MRTLLCTAVLVAALMLVGCDRRFVSANSLTCAVRLADGVACAERASGMTLEQADKLAVSEWSKAFDECEKRPEVREVVDPEAFGPTFSYCEYFSFLAEAAAWKGLGFDPHEAHAELGRGDPNKYRTKPEAAEARAFAQDALEEAEARCAQRFSNVREAGACMKTMGQAAFDNKMRELGFIPGSTEPMKPKQ
jgi:hypothetical protein